MKRYFSSIFFFLVLLNGLLFEQSISAMGVLETQLTTLKGNLGGLKGKLGNLSSKLKDLNSALLGVPKPAPKGSAIPKELMDKFKNKFEHESGINEKTFKPITEKDITDEIKKIETYTKTEQAIIKPLANSTLQEALTASSLEKSINIIFTDKTGVLDACYDILKQHNAWLSSKDTSVKKKALQFNFVQSIKNIQKLAQAVTDCIKEAEEEKKKEKIIADIRSALTSSSPISPIPLENLDNEINAITNIVTLDPRTTTAKNSLLNLFKEKSFRDFLQVIDNEKLLLEYFDKKYSFVDKFTPIFNNLKVIEYDNFDKTKIAALASYDQKNKDISSDFKKINDFINSIEAQLKKIADDLRDKAEKEKQKKDEAERIIREAEEKKKKEESVKRMALELKTIADLIASNADYIKKLTPAELNGTLKPKTPGFITNFWSNRLGYNLLEANEKEILKKAFEDLTEDDAKKIAPTKQQPFLTILVTILGLSYDFHAVGKLKLKAAGNPSAKGQFLDKELAKVIADQRLLNPPPAGGPPPPPVGGPPPPPAGGPPGFKPPESKPGRADLLADIRKRKKSD